MTKAQDYEAYVEALRTSAGLQDETRLTQGEIAAVIHTAYGTLQQAAIDAHIEYKALAQYKRVVSFYQNSTRVEIGASEARMILDNADTLRFSHLRIAMRLRDYEEARAALEVAQDQAMTTREFERYVAQKKREAGHKPTKYMFDARAGYRVTIARAA